MNREVELVLSGLHASGQEQESGGDRAAGTIF